MPPRGNGDKEAAFTNQLDHLLIPSSDEASDMKLRLHTRVLADNHNGFT